MSIHLAYGADSMNFRNNLVVDELNPVISDPF